MLLTISSNIPLINKRPVNQQEEYVFQNKDNINIKEKANNKSLKMKFCYENMSKGTKFQDYCIDYQWEEEVHRPIIHNNNS